MPSIASVSHALACALVTTPIPKTWRESGVMPYIPLLRLTDIDALSYVEESRPVPGSVERQRVVKGMGVSVGKGQIAPIAEAQTPPAREYIQRATGSLHLRRHPQFRPHGPRFTFDSRNGARHWHPNAPLKAGKRLDKVSFVVVTRCSKSGCERGWRWRQTRTPGPVALGFNVETRVMLKGTRINS